MQPTSFEGLHITDATFAGFLLQIHYTHFGHIQIVLSGHVK